VDTKRGKEGVRVIQWVRFLLVLMLGMVFFPPFSAKAHDSSQGFSDIYIEPKRVMKVYLEQIFLLELAKTPWNGDLDQI
jgi:hypothetical protein